MKNLAKIILTVFIGFGVYSCLAPIDIKTKNGDTYINIYGYLTSDTMQHRIRITYSDYFFSSEAPVGIGNATVSISDGDKTMYLTESPDTIGLYLTDDKTYAEEGKSYVLNVEVDIDNDGINEHFQASANVPYTVHADSIVVAPGKIPFVPTIRLYGEIPQNQQNHLAIYISKNNDTIGLFDYFMILEDWYYHTDSIQGTEFPLFFEDGIEIGDTLHFRVNSFAGEFARFVSQVKTETSPSNPIFSNPPANVSSNIISLNPDKEINVVGFFSAFAYKKAFAISDKAYPPMMPNKE